jgi:Flp pilus assembly protein TadD
LNAPKPVPGSVTVNLRDLVVAPKARPYLERANRDIDKGKFKAALASLEKAVSIQPDLPSALSAMGQVLMKLKRAPEAEAAFARALDIAPDYPEAMRGIGYLYLTTGREEQAVVPLSKAAALDPMDGAVHAYLGEALYQTKRYPEAEKPLLRALSLDPGNFHASYRLGYVCLQLHRYSEALEYFRLFLKSNAGLDDTKVRAIVQQLERQAPGR